MDDVSTVLDEDFKILRWRHFSGGVWRCFIEKDSLLKHFMHSCAAQVNVEVENLTLFYNIFIFLQALCYITQQQCMGT